MLPKIASAGVEPHVLVVDDGSPDGTGRSPTGWPGASPRSRWCTATARRDSGKAYLAGFTHALAGGFDLLLQMDCDFSHDPADLPRLIAAAEAKATSYWARAMWPKAA